MAEKDTNAWNYSNWQYSQTCHFLKYNEIELNWIELKKKNTKIKGHVLLYAKCCILYICKPKTMLEKESTIWNN